MNEGIAFWFDGFSDECHTGLDRGFAAFFHVAFCTGANYVRPDRFAAHTPGDNVVEGQFAGWMAFAAILTAILVAGEDVSSIELYFGSRQAVIKQQPNDSRHGNRLNNAYQPQTIAF